jgi:hypothetical protein
MEYGVRNVVVHPAAAFCTCHTGEHLAAQSQSDSAERHVAAESSMCKWHRHSMGRGKAV